MKTLVLSNPHSRRASRQRAGLARTGAVVETTQSAADVPARVAEHGLTSDDVVVFHGGDGTVQQGLTALLDAVGGAVDRLPIIALLPGGTTNMTARDLNVSPRLSGCIDRLATRRPSVSERRVVTIATSAGTRQVGFFFGAGAIVHGIRYFHENTGVVGIGTALAMARTVWGILHRQPPYADAVEVAMNGCAAMRFLLLATTLDRLINGTTPFWGGGAGALKVTSIQQDADRFLPSLLQVLRGRKPAAAGYTSAREDALTLRFDGPYTLDGELFETRGATLEVASAPLRIWSL